jgi:hypothetical protein
MAWRPEPLLADMLTPHEVRPGAAPLDRWDALLALLASLAVLPLFVVRYPPSHDFPQQLAILKLLTLYPDHGLDGVLERDLGRTQYCLFYALAWLLSRWLGELWALKLVVAAIGVALPFSVWSLARALGAERRLALAAVPLALSSPLQFGLYGFCAGVALSLFGVTAALRLAEAPSPGAWLRCALLFVLLTFTHPVPFGLSFAAAAYLLASRDPRRLALGASALLPGLATFGVWLTRAAAAQRADGLLGLAPRGLWRMVRQLPAWLYCVQEGPWDELLFGLWLGALVWIARAPRAPLASGIARRARLACLIAALVAWAGYWLLPSKMGWVYPGGQRFALLGATFGLVLLTSAPAARVRRAGPALAALSLLIAASTGFTYRRAAEEGGDIDAAIAAIPPHRRVASLIFEQDSRFVREHPFRHYGALYQAQRGGLVSRTLLATPTSPFTFKRGQRPKAPDSSRTAAEIDPSRDLSEFEFVLVKDGPGVIASRPAQFQELYRGGPYRVYRNLSFAIRR